MARKRKPMPKMVPPPGQEYAYRRTLLTLTSQMKALFKKHMAPSVPGMVAEATDIHLPTGMIRQDAWQDDLHNAIRRITEEMTTPVNRAIKDAVTRIGPGVNSYNKSQWQKLIRSQYAVDPTREDPKRYEALMTEWSRINAALIQDIPNKTINEISQLTQDALRSGKTSSDMEKDIYDIMSERTDVSDSRAKLIARDQVSKLNGNLTQSRQEDIGVESYIWRTVGDERVRETHDENDGETFRWDDPPAETGHPGEDYQCRCHAEPILPEFVSFEASLLEEA